MNPRVTDVEYKSPYQLIIKFTDENVKIFDIQPYLQYPIYQPLRNETLCSKAKVLNGIVVWNEYIDFDPDLLFLESKVY